MDRASKAQSRGPRSAYQRELPFALSQHPVLLSRDPFLPVGIGLQQLPEPGQAVHLTAEPEDRRSLGPFHSPELEPLRSAVLPRLNGEEDRAQQERQHQPPRTSHRWYISRPG